MSIVRRRRRKRGDQQRMFAFCERRRALMGVTITLTMGDVMQRGRLETFEQMARRLARNLQRNGVWRLED